MSGRRKWCEVRRPGNTHLEQGFGAAIDAGLWLPELRRQAGLTQEQVAERLGVTQSWVSQLERQTDVQLSTLVAYVAALGGTLRLAATLPGMQEVDLRTTPAHTIVPLPVPLPILRTLAEAESSPPPLPAQQ